jgi:steroid 5-alpha reductase family enzyme
MSWGPLLVNLGVTAVTGAVLMLATFAYAMRTRVHAIMDTVWALWFVIIALVSFGLSAGHGLAGRRVLVLILVTVWGVRLSAHIYLRNRGQGEDKRYVSLLRRNTGSPARCVLRYIYWAQGRVFAGPAASSRGRPLGLLGPGGRRIRRAGHMPRTADAAPCRLHGRVR